MLCYASPNPSQLPTNEVVANWLGSSAGAAVPVQFAHKLIRGFQVGGHYSQFHQSSGMQVHVSQSHRADRIFMASATAHLPSLKVPPLVGSLAVIASR